MASHKLSPSHKRSLEMSTATYAANVDQAGPYLAARGIDRQTAATHRLGFVADPLPGDEDYAGRLSIPYITPNGVEIPLIDDQAVDPQRTFYSTSVVGGAICGSARSPGPAVVTEVSDQAPYEVRPPPP
mgnify:CR=1 FL=1